MFAMGDPASRWTRLIRWVDRDLPLLQLTPLVAMAPCAIMLLVVGPESPAILAALALYALVTLIIAWRMVRWIGRRRAADQRVRRAMFRRLKTGRWFPVIRRRR